MGGEQGDETYTDVPLVSLALSPPIFTFIGNTDIYTNSVWKSSYFWVFADISARSSRKEKSWELLMYFFFACAVLRQGFPIFKS